MLLFVSKRHITGLFLKDTYVKEYVNVDRSASALCLQFMTEKNGRIKHTYNMKVAHYNKSQLLFNIIADMHWSASQD